MSDKARLKRLVTAALLLAAGFLLPFLTAGLRPLGQRLSPMHLPVMLCGFVCGGAWGAAVGLVLPLLRSLLVGAPVLFPSAVAMAAELAVYGFLCGFLRQRLPKRPVFVVLALLGAMVGGRVVWGGVSCLLYGLCGDAFSLSVFWTRGVVETLPGMLVQLVLIPPLVILSERKKDNV